MEMSSASFHERSTKCGEAKVALSGKIPQEEHPNKSKIKTKVP